MKMTTVSHYCQKCLAANPLGQEFCARCGTRLMIVVDPPAARYEFAESAVSSEEHLLERISALESRQGRLTEKLERALDLLLRQAQNSHFDRALVKALAGLLSDDGIIENERLERVWIDRCQREAEEQQESERREGLRLKILARFLGIERASFERLVNEGFLLIEDEQVGGGIRTLQRAAELNPGNAPLLAFLGEHFYRRGKTAKAQSYLSLAYATEPTDGRVQLLLGLTCADEGDAERAKQLLRSSTRLGGSAFAAHFGLGRLFVAQEQLQDAVREFKLALVTKASPEAHYAIGLVYYQQQRDSLAARHLRKAIELDQGYREALHLLGLVYERSGRQGLAHSFFERAGSGAFAAPVSRNLKPRSGAAAAADHRFRLSPTKSRKLITCGDRRLAEMLRQNALNVGIAADKPADASRR